jgi:NAD(P)-dependent dehydrogenase (short-subunit alcohol dehydrogenase family)
LGIPDSLAIVETVLNLESTLRIASTGDPVILITTAGKVGSETARLLAQREVPVRVVVRHPEKATALAQAGVDVVEDNARALTLMAEGDCDYVTDDVPSMLGRPPRTLEQFAADHAAAFA